MRIRCVGGRYQLTQPYGYDKNYPLNGGWHTGVDYVSPDLKILAPDVATVVAIGQDTTNGQYIILESGVYRDYFCHLASYIAVQGQKVTKGQSIGIMGKSGYATGVHVHHTLRVNGQQSDPELFIGKGVIMIEDNDLWFTRFYKLVRQLQGRDLTRAEFRINFVGFDAFKITESLSDNIAADKALFAQDLGQKAITEDWQGQINGKYILVTESIYRKVK
jgi:hypothetical protein